MFRVITKKNILVYDLFYDSPSLARSHLAIRMRLTRWLTDWLTEWHAYRLQCYYDVYIRSIPWPLD